MPLMEAAAYKTYHVATPLETHFRAASCAEVRCEKYEHGWGLRVEAHPEQMIYTATHCGRRYRVEQVAEGETWLVFEPGQPCFAASTHRIKVDRPEIYLVTDGDWRGNPYGTDPYRHTRADWWVEDFAIHQDRIAHAVQQG
jgi:hypothetical protein